MESISVYSLLARKGLKREDLNWRTKKEHRDKIAVKLSSDWKSCAAVLGLTEEKVETLSRENKWSRNRRLAMLQRWDADNGEEATYMRLVQALAAIGRDDLAVYLVDIFILEQGYLFRSLGALSFSLKRRCWTGFGVMMFFFLLGGISVYFWSLINVNPAEHSPSPIDVTDISSHFKTMNPNQDESLSAEQIDISQMLDEELKVRSKCEQFSYELPQYKADFFGREDSIQDIVSKIVTNPVPLLNINGPLGCGKSQLAIQLGHRLLKEGVYVSYIDVSDRKFDQFTGNVKNAQKDSLPKLPLVSYVHYSMSDKNYTAVHDVALMKELSNWSKTLTCLTVLILDNCDSIKDKSTFVRFLKTLVVSSKHHLKIIATSRNFLNSTIERWTISELGMDTSMKLLKQAAPSVNKDHLDKLLALLGGCPLALKITGNMLEYSRGHVDTILRQIEYRHLNRVSGSRQQFINLVSIVYEFLPHTLRTCGHYLHMFPGSFDRISGENVMAGLNCGENIGQFIRRSLLEQYFLNDEVRLKMPALVGEYFKENNQPRTNNRQKTIDKKEFRKKFFMNYVDLFVLEIMNPFQLRSPDEYNLKFSIESHNINLLTTVIFTNRVQSSAMYPKEMAALVPLSLQGWIPFHRILDHYLLYKQLLAEMKPVCKFLPGSRCINFYSQLISNVYHSECNNASLKFAELIRVVIYGKRNCGALFLNGTRISMLQVLNRLDLSIQSFLITAGLLSNKYIIWVVKAFGFAIVIVSYLMEFASTRTREKDTYNTSFDIWFLAVLSMLGMFIIYFTGNLDLAVILHLYIPSTVILFSLMLFFCQGKSCSLVFSYLFRMWCVVLFFVSLLKMFFWLYSAITVPLTNVMLL